MENLNLIDSKIYKDNEGACFQSSAVAKLPTIFGNFTINAFGAGLDNDHLYLEYGNITTESPIVRIQSECVTGEVFGSLKCDCRDQLLESIEIIKEAGSGIIIYMRQEGRGIGLFNKVNAYRLQEDGYDTIEANHALNLETDLRDFKLASIALRKRGIFAVKLISNNNDKVQQLENNGINVISLIHTKPNINPQNQHYIETKALKLNHSFNKDE